MSSTTANRVAEPPPDLTPAAVTATVVAAGVNAVENLSLRAVIVITPTEAAHLGRWPTRAHRWLGSVSAIRACPGNVETCTADGPSRWETWSIRDRGAALEERTLGELDALWTRLLIDDDEDWDTLADLWTKGLDRRPSMLPVVSLPTAEAGLAMPLERGRAVLEALAEPDSPILARAPTRPAPAALVALGRPWLGEPGVTARYAALHRDGGPTRDDGLDRLFGPPDVSDWLDARRRGDAAGRRAGDLAYGRPLEPAALLEAALGRDGRDMLDVFDRMHALHHVVVTAAEGGGSSGDGTPSTLPRERRDVDDRKLRVQRRFAQLMASPSLMRLFGLARDVVLTPERPEGKRGTISYWKIWPAGHEAGMAAAAKLRLDAGAVAGFYPAPSAEWPRRPVSSGTGTGTVRERDGVVVLSREDGHPQQHDIVTMEAALAVESDIRSQAVLRDTPGAGATLPTPLTGGLALVRIGAEEPERTQGNIRFSEDLRAFDRLDVGVVTDDPVARETVWRCTQHRQLVWGDPATRPRLDGATRKIREEAAEDRRATLRGERRGWIEDALAKLTRDAGLARHEMDAASCTRGTLLVAKDVPCQDARVAIYDGNPGGAAVNEPWWDPPAPTRRAHWDEPLLPIIALPKVSGLALDQTISLPAFAAAQGRATLPPLRFGWRYRMGLRRVWLGGVTRPLAEAERLYARDRAAALPAPTEDGHPFLRHEPIAAPLVALPESVPKPGPGSKHEDTLQSAEGAVVVTWEGAAPSGHRALESTARVLIAPPVSLEFATLHGVFDDRRPDDLLTVKMEVTGPVPPRDSPPATTPPKSAPKSELTITVPRDMYRRLELYGEIQGEPRPGEPPPATGTEQVSRSGDPLRLRVVPEGRAKRSAPYYPDPAATHLAIGLREADGVTWAEPPRLMRLTGLGAPTHHAWPNVAPVHIELRATREEQPRRALSVASDPVRLPLGDPGGTHVRSVTVTLAQGEAVTLQAWLVPTVEQIAEWFDVCDSATRLALSEGRRQAVSGDQAACRAGLTELLGHRVCAPLTGGAGGSEEDARYQVASLLWARLREGPVEEISKVRSMSLLHAVKEPSAEPDAVPADPLTLTRRLDTSLDAVATFLAGGAANSGDEDAAVQAIVSGGVQVDLATTSGVVVEAIVAAPDSDLDEGPPPTGPGLVPLPPAKPRWLDESGAIKPEAYRAVELLRIEGIPAPAGEAPRKQSLSLASLQRAAAAGSVPGLKAVIGGRLRNGGARRVALRVTALPRHAALLTTGPEEATPLPKVWNSTPTKTRLPASPKTPGLVWLKATIPPAQPDPQELLPTFTWDTKAPPAGTADPLVWSMTRDVGAQLTLRPPGLTSGEGEEIGLITWPPPLPLGVTGGWGPEPDDKVLGALVEEDIGPLGPFVSAWARDPLRDADQNGGPAYFPIRREHFDAGGPGGAAWEDRVLVPVPGGSAAEDLAEEAVASILRLTPRRAGDLWVVDIPFAAQALRRTTDRFVRLGLVRFQPQARADRTSGSTRRGIRCSAPTSVWTVMPPRRHVRVTALRLGGGHTVVTVQLSGAGDGRRAGNQPNTVVNVTLVEARGGRELVRERARNIPVKGDDPAIFLPVVIGAEAGERSWTASFRVPAREGVPLRDELRDLSILVEEADALPDGERGGGLPSPEPRPGDEPACGELVRAGIRFFARLDLGAGLTVG